MQFVPANLEQNVGELGSNRRVQFGKPAVLTHCREYMNQVLTFIVTSAMCLHLIVDTISSEQDGCSIRRCVAEATWKRE